MDDISLVCQLSILRRGKRLPHGKVEEHVRLGWHGDEGSAGQDGVSRPANCPEFVAHVIGEVAKWVNDRVIEAMSVVRRGPLLSHLGMARTSLRTRPGYAEDGVIDMIYVERSYLCFGRCYCRC